MTQKICPIITKLDQQEKTEEFITYKLIRQPCLKEQCQLWVEHKYQTHSEGELVVEGEDIMKLKDVKSHDSSHCGLIK